MNNKLAIILAFIIILASSCSPEAESPTSKLMESFSFLVSRNPDYIEYDVNGYILGSEIYIGVPYGTDISGLIADFETTGNSVTVNGENQVSGVTVNNFNNSETNPVVYSVEADDGTIVNFNVRVPWMPLLSSLYTAGSNGGDQANSIAIDTIGNIYIAGSYAGDIQFDPGEPTKPFSANTEAFLTKFNYDGSYSYTHVITGSSIESVDSVTTDNYNNVYATGYFLSSDANFDPEGSNDTHSAVNSYYDIFITKLDKHGNYIWTKTIGSDNLERAFVILSDNEDNIYIAGEFRSSSVDFDPSPGIDSHSGLSRNSFLTRINHDGTYGWTKIFKSNSCSIRSGCINNQGNIIVSGFATQDVTFPNGDVFSPSGLNIFTAEITPDGSCIQTGGIPSTGNQYPYSMATDSAGNIFISGEWDSNFQPNPTNPSLLYTGTDNFFVVSYSSSMEYRWANPFIGPGGNSSQAITVDKNDNIFITGTFEQTLEFDPGNTASEITSISSINEIFIAKYDNDGSFIWVYGIGSSDSNNTSKSILVSPSNKIYFSGAYNGTSIDFNPDSGPEWFASATTNDIFLAELIPH